MVNIKKKDYVFVAKDGEAYTVSQTRPGADCGTDHELVIARFRLKLKKEENTMRSFRYNLNQIPYVYTVEVMNRFKGLGLVDRVPEELQTEVRYIVQETITEPSQKGCKKAKWLSSEALQIAEERREMKGKEERERYTQLNVEFQRIARRDKKAFLNEKQNEKDQKALQENWRCQGKHFMQGWAR